MEKGFSYPSPQELVQPPKNLKERFEQQCREEGIDIRNVMPKEISERLDDYSETVKAALLENFGTTEIPKELSDELDTILKEIESGVVKNGYEEEVDEKIIERLKILAVQATNFKEQPKNITITSVPEEGYVISYTT